MYQPAEEQHLFQLSKAYLEGTAATQQPLAQQLDELRRLIVYHEWRYYIGNDPVIADFEYDQLYKKLEAIEAQHPEWVVPESPTQRVSPDLIENFAATPHLTPMLSLANSYNAEDLQEWDAQLRRLLVLDAAAPLAYSVEPKFDGGSIALVYEDDVLVRAATRGNGSVGEEITANAKVIRSIPLRAAFSKLGIQRVELRGEVLMSKAVFAQLNQERQREGTALFANPRNAATGGLRMKDPREVAKRGLEAFVYTLSYAVAANGESVLEQFATHWESLEALHALGFKVPTVERQRCPTIGEVIDFCQHWQQRREDYPYEIDGMVVKVDRRELQERAGFTAHHPRWAMAYKFQAKQATSRLLQVEYQVGKVGSITPVAKIEPVQLAGVTVASVSLHNEDFIRSKDLHLGDTVLVERAGDVIPYIVKALPELRDGHETPIVFPSHCPINTTTTPVALVREGTEAAWRCPDCVCGAQDLQRIIFHVSKDAMDIEGLGKSIVERFYDLGWLKTLADVYRLDLEQVAQLEGFGEKSAANLAASIAKAKTNPIHRLLHSLSIHHLGKKVSKLLAAEIGHVLELKDWDQERFLQIKDVGPVVAENVQRFFANPQNVALLETMEALGVNLRQTAEDRPAASQGNGPLAGKTILFTGTLEQLGRKEAQEKAEAAGAKVLSGISAKLDILVAGSAAGSKLKKAQELGSVEIISEAEFLARIAVD